MSGNGEVAMTIRTAKQVGAEIQLERQAFLDADEHGDLTDAAQHYQRMDELLEEYAHIPHPRLPSDSDGHRRPQAY